MISLVHTAIKTEMNRGAQRVFDFEHDPGSTVTVAFLPLLPIFSATQVRRNLATRGKIPQLFLTNPARRHFVNNLSRNKTLDRSGESAF
jgi:hypothetical protein